MRPNRKMILGGAAGLLALNLAVCGASGGPSTLALTPNDAGRLGTLSTGGAVNARNPFFQTLGGANGRTCATCHDPASAWSISGSAIRQRFDATGGADPLFAAVDGANSPHADMSTPEARRAACSLLLNRGVFRIALPLPPNAEFSVDAVNDPYGATTPDTLSVYRRPQPAANTRLETTMMWDGRILADGRSITDRLVAQAQAAALGHMQASNPGAAQLQQIAQFEVGLFSAQMYDGNAKSLQTGSPASGVKGLQRQPFYPGINDPFGGDPKSKKFNPQIFNLYGKWLRRDWNTRGVTGARNLIAKGEQVFNTRQFIVTGVRGFNDVLGQERVVATCGSCHNTPNVGTRSVNQLMDLDIHALLRDTGDLPRFTLRNTATGETVETTDPGQGLTTGKWADVGKFKVPGLRGLAARAPYFHDGSAASLHDVVDFYYNRFNIDAGPGEKEALEAFLRAL